MHGRWSSRTWLIAIVALSIILRITVALYYGDVVDAPPLLTDQRSYHALGARLLQGHGYSFEQPWYPFIPANTPTAFWSFLYSLFVAGVYAVFGVHPLAVRLVQAILGGILLPLMVYRLTRRLIPSPPPPAALPLTATAITALYGYYILYATTMMTETLYIIALLWSLELALRLGEQLRTQQHPPRSIPISLQLGLSLGLAALLRQSILPWVPVLFLWLLWQTTFKRSNVQTFKRSNVKRVSVQTLLPLAVSALVLLAMIAPWTIRNYRVYGQFLLLNSNTGYAMYSAQHPMHGTRFSEFDAAPMPQNLSGTNEAQWDRELLRRGLQFVLDEPGRYLRLSLSRVRAFFEFWPTPDTTLINNIGRTTSFGLCLPFMLYGLYLSVKQSNFSVQTFNRLSLIYLFIIVYSLLHIFTWAMVRYRLPVDAVLIPFAALGLLDLYERVRRWLKAKELSKN